LLKPTPLKKMPAKMPDRKNKIDRRATPNIGWSSMTDVHIANRQPTSTNKTGP